MSLKSNLLIALAAIGLIGTASVASAAPLSVDAATTVKAAATGTSNVEPVRWVCGPYGRCVWVRHRPHVHSYHYRPYRSYGYYGFYSAPRYHRWYW
jgi:hypothetical protein